MDVLPLIATAVGAVIALSGTLLADLRRDRQQRERDNQQVRREIYVSFALALNASHDGLRQMGDSSVPAEERRAAASRVLTEAGLYAAREQLLIIASEPVATAGETAFRRVRGIRDAVLGGATTRSERYRDAYRDWAEAVWQFRMTVRGELGQPTLTLATEDEHQ